MQQYDRLKVQNFNSPAATCKYAEKDTQSTQSYLRCRALKKDASCEGGLNRLIAHGDAVPQYRWVGGIRRDEESLGQCSELSQIL